MSEVRKYLKMKETLGRSSENIDDLNETANVRDLPTTYSKSKKVMAKQAANK